MQGDLRKACELYHEAGSLGSADAYFNLALLAYEGRYDGPAIEVPEGYTPASVLMLRAAELGDAIAHYVLWANFEQGEGVPQSAERAQEHLLQAAERGHPDAKMHLALRTQSGKDLVTALLAAAEAGSAESWVVLGEMFLEEPEGPNYGSAIKAFAMAAAMGHPGGMYNVAVMHYNGQGVEQSFEKAAEAYSAAAEMVRGGGGWGRRAVTRAQGIPEALLRLGEMVANGEGFPANEAQGARLIESARRQIAERDMLLNDSPEAERK